MPFMFKPLFLSFSRKLLSHLFLFKILFSLQFLIMLKLRILLFSTRHAHVSTPNQANKSITHSKTLPLLRANQGNTRVLY